MRKDIKRILSKVMATTMVVCCMAGVAPSNSVNAAADTEVFYAEKLSVGNYLDKAPKPAVTDTEHKDWVFAGWYNDEECTSYITSKDGITEDKYAKFVPADVLSVKCQNLAGTTAESEETNLRIITTVDSLKYREVGFEVTVGDKTESVKITTVYNKIKEKDNTELTSYVPTDFNEGSKYFATVTLTEVPKVGFDKGIMIKPYWITMDGTKVDGISRYARIEDSWEGIVNIPVRVYSDEVAAVGKVKVTFDKENFTYLGAETGDLGDVFEEMYIANDGNGNLTCIGNTVDGKNVAVDGMFVSLRFKKSSEHNSNATFELSNEEFANYDEKYVYTNKADNTFDVSDVIYKMPSAN